jgi:hypothetical protein
MSPRPSVFLLFKRPLFFLPIFSGVSAFRRLRFLFSRAFPGGRAPPLFFWPFFPSGAVFYFSSLSVSSCPGADSETIFFRRDLENYFRGSREFSLFKKKRGPRMKKLLSKPRLIIRP